MQKYIFTQSDNPVFSPCRYKITDNAFIINNLLSLKEQEYKDAFANPYNAANYGYIDDVIEPRNTRFRVIRALQSLATKKLVNPAKKHSNIPL